ncbi:nuclease-related domain-containing protein [Syntrophorhabdus aromaticivorans]|uniref:nuclease-related domain-containing protein n=1 Tax=Syntrophorhabdus aromaticivorans TaxID=328301 RepID=UPI0004261162|nr:nuclease-related domain-containing protein [Syntrophorhabdus aromaticivorans]
MREVFLSNHLQRQANRSFAICLASLAFALTLLAVGVAMASVLVIWASMVALAISGFIVTKYGPTHMTYRHGMQGERILRNWLRSSGLDDDHTAYYNLPLNGNGRASDIDCILVGPLGLFIFEVKHHHGLIFHRNGIWARIKIGQGGTFYRGQLGDPSGQLYRNIRRLKGLLGRTDGLWFNGAVVFTNPRTVLDIEGLRWVRAVAVKDLDHVLSKRTVLSVEQTNSINSRLASLVKK